MSDECDLCGTSPALLECSQCGRTICQWCNRSSGMDEDDICDECAEDEE